jgi:putative SOS response-associated peptidase YedK
VGLDSVLDQRARQAAATDQRSCRDRGHQHVLQRRVANGRALVFADGWYEWVKDEADPKIKHPYFIRLKSQHPMFFGALAEVHPGLEPGDSDGFVIITAASDTGMVDIHDHRPLVLTPELAREWLEPDLSSESAEEIASEHCQPTEDFEWYPVSSMVGNVRNHGQELILPVG